STRCTCTTTRSGSSTPAPPRRRGPGSRSSRRTARPNGPRWAPTRTSSPRPRSPSAIRSNMRSGSAGPSCGAATSAISRPSCRGGSQVEAQESTLKMTRWTVTSGSNVRSRGVVVIEAGDHHWRGSAEGNGAVDALYRAVDEALHDVLAGHPKLVAYEVHALAEGPDAEGQVAVVVEPPAGGAGARATGRYEGSARSTNIIAASIEAYVPALNAMLAEAPRAGAA